MQSGDRRTEAPAPTASASVESIWRHCHGRERTMESQALPNERRRPCRCDFSKRAESPDCSGVSSDFEGLGTGNALASAQLLDRRNPEAIHMTRSRFKPRNIGLPALPRRHKESGSAICSEDHRSLGSASARIGAKSALSRFLRTTVRRGKILRHRLVAPSAADARRHSGH
jgi:hypothetical protein